MSDLTDFLLARIVEDEAMARTAMGDTYGRWSSWNRSWDTTPTRDLAAGGERIAALPTAIDEHVCRHDPARVLAECEAKRRIVALSDEALRRQVDRRDASAFGADLMHGDVLRLLALPYADHPDYDEAWRP